MQVLNNETMASIKRYLPEVIFFLFPFLAIIFFVVVPIVCNTSWSTNFDEFENSPVESSLGSNEVKSSAIALLVSVCPMIFDLAIDIYNGSNFVSNKTKRCFIARAVISIATVLMASQIIAQLSLTVNIAAAYWISLNCYKLVLLCSYLFCLYIVNPQIFTMKQTLFLVAFGVVTAITRVYILSHASIALYFVFFGIFFSFYFIWINQLWKHRKSGFSVDDFASFYYLFVLFVQLMAIWCQVFYNAANNNITDSPLNGNAFVISLSNYIEAFCFIIMAIMPGRIARIETVEYKDSLLKTKQSYVRYISHELRTPLNTVHMGLKFLIDLIPISTTNPLEKERRSTLMDIANACNVALEVLNDFLFYDKLQSGLVTLQKQNLPVIDFLSSSLNMFSVQVRSKKLHLSLVGIDTKGDNISTYSFGNEMLESNVISSIANNTHFSNENVDKDDVVSADKAKICQVIRNILSNAIKFTPEGGDIRVFVSFLPSKTTSTPFLSQKTSFITRPRKPSIPTLPLSLKNIYETTFSPRRKSWKVYSDSVDGIVDHYENTVTPRPHDVTTNTPALHDIEQGHGHSNSHGHGHGNVGRRKSQGSNNEHHKTIESTKSAISDKQFIDGTLVIEFRDSGAGISPENQKRLFHEIVQFNPDKLQGGGGSGLGLFITKGIVDLHGGNILVFSEGEDKGTTFRLELPMRKCREVIKPLPDNGAKLSTSSKSISLSTQLTTTLQRQFSTFLGGNTTATQSDNRKVFHDWNFKEDLTSVTIKTSVSTARESENNVDSTSNFNSNNQMGNNVMDFNAMDTIPELSHSHSVSDIDNHHDRDVKSDKMMTIEPLTAFTFSSRSTDIPYLTTTSTSTHAVVTQPMIQEEQRKLNLLIVDDSPMNRKMLRHLLEAKGHICDEAVDGEVALNMMKQLLVKEEDNDNKVDHHRKDVSKYNKFKYDAILMDYMMPRMNGPTSTKEIRVLGYQGLILGVTGNAMDEDQNIFMKAGATKVFPKPLELNLIFETFQGIQCVYT